MYNIKIEPFRMKVTPEQSIIAQRIILDNGYMWNGGDTIIKYHTITHLIFRHEFNPVLLWSDRRNDNDVDLTFNEFMNRYSIQGQRRNKLKKLYNGE